MGRYNTRLNTELNGWIDWDLNSYDLINFINAFDDPYLGASTIINNERVYIKKAQLHGGETPNHPFMAGLISRHDENWIIVSTKDKNSLIVEIVNNNKKKNIIKNLTEGDRFYTPSLKIEKSRKVRVKYTAKGLNNFNYMMQDNNWYGHRSILAEFCIDDRPSFSSIHHGWSIIYNNGDFGKKILFSLSMLVKEVEKTLKKRFS